MGDYGPLVPREGSSTTTTIVNLIEESSKPQTPPLRVSESTHVEPSEPTGRLGRRPVTWALRGIAAQQQTSDQQTLDRSAYEDDADYLPSTQGIFKEYVDSIGNPDSSSRGSPSPRPPRTFFVTSSAL